MKNVADRGWSASLSHMFCPVQIQDTVILGWQRSHGTRYLGDPWWKCISTVREIQTAAGSFDSVRLRLTPLKLTDN